MYNYLFVSNYLLWTFINTTHLIAHKAGMVDYFRFIIMRSVSDFDRRKCKCLGVFFIYHHLFYV